MAETIHLLTSLEILDSLHIKADGRGKSVTILKQDLINLLVDNTRLLQAAKQRGATIRAPEPKHKREVIE